MTLKKLIASLVVSTSLGVAALAPAAAQPDAAFSALEGVQAQALSAEEMDAIAGELNAYDIAAALTSLAARLDRFPKLQAATLALAAYYTTNATAINDLYKRLGIFTECRSCTP